MNKKHRKSKTVCRQRRMPGPFPRLQEWCHGRAVGIRIAAKLLAIAPDDTHWGLEARRTDALPSSFFEPTDLKTWQRFYYRSRAYRYTILLLMCNGNEKAAARIALPLEAVKMEERIPREIRMERWALATPAQRMFAFHRGYGAWCSAEKELDRVLAALCDNTKPPTPLVADAVRSPEFHFFFQVYAPCYCLYKMPPSKLLARAGAGDALAAEQLLGLDPSAASHPRLARYLHQLDQKGLTHTRVQLAQAQARTPYRPVAMWSLKASYGAFLLTFAKGIKCRLNSGDIRRLYNAIAQDLKHVERDRSLPLEEEAFRKGLQKHARPWKALLAGNQDSQKSSQ